MHLDKDILSQTIALGDKVYHFSDLFSINQESISDEFTNQPGRYAYLGMQLAKSEVLMEELDAEKQKVYAQLDDVTRRDFEDSKEKYTEAKVKSAIILDEAYWNADNAWRSALLNYKILRAMVDAMRQRGEMLISLGATLRQEYDVTGMHINELKDKLRK